MFRLVRNRKVENQPYLHAPNFFEDCYSSKNNPIMIQINFPLIIWCVILGSIILLAIFHNRIHRHHRHFSFGNVIDTCSEREEFYVPGDNLVDDEDD